MEENSSTNAPQGRGVGVAGFVISIVALVLWLIISGAAATAALAGGGLGLSVFWILVSLTGTVLSIIGMNKLGRTGGKRGLSIAGMILGIIATILSVTTLLGVMKIRSSVGDRGIEILKDIENADTAKLRESLNEIMKAIPDSTQQESH
jgi:hypothetical protein